MPTALDNMIAAASGILASYHGVTVTLKVGRGQTAPFTASFDEQETATISEQTRRETKRIARVYYLPAASLIVNGSTVIPRAGMVLVDGSQEFEILPNPGKKAAELLPDGVTYLAHTKQVG